MILFGPADCQIQSMIWWVTLSHQSSYQHSSSCSLTLAHVCLLPHCAIGIKLLSISLALSSMYCSKCNHNFKRQQALLAHMNHPQSGCFSHFNEVVNLADDLARFKLHSQHWCDASLGISDTEEPMNIDPAMDLNDSFMEEDNEEHVWSSGDGGGFFIEEFDGAAKGYGCGKTFMMEFDNDRFSNEHNDNLYYPFASRDEWELASFLLRSNLSMAAIDRFLLLKLVRSFL